ncbi:MAG: DUF488 family protein [Actinomycetota bacterium]|nr:DUF488 family protein [Actinomycetota bacterium]
MEIRIKRIYDDHHDGDGFRVLVDRLWPRGVKKQAAEVDVWAKEIAPSDGLRKEFHDLGPESFDEFRDHYRDELEAHRGELEELLDEAGDASGGGKVKLTLLYASRDEKHNNAVVLAEVLRSMDA